MAKVDRVEVLMVDLQPKVKRTDAIQAFVSQETPIVRIFSDDGVVGTGYSYTIGTGGHAARAARIREIDIGDERRDRRVECRCRKSRGARQHRVVAARHVRERIARHHLSLDDDVAGLRVLCGGMHAARECQRTDRAA